jgi:hypothetical protein
MTQEEKDLLLKDLCARLPYGVKVQVDNHCWVDFRKDIPVKLTLDNSYRILLGVTLGYVKPCLFPLSSMTEEQKKEYDSIIYHNVELHWERYYDVIDVDCCEELYDFYNKNHLDYRGLIPMGLAIDATELSVYTNSDE